jgi:hypothetical protein
MTIAVKLPETAKVQSRNRRAKKKKCVITEFSGEFSEWKPTNVKVLKRNKKKKEFAGTEATPGKTASRKF